MFPKISNRTEPEHKRVGAPGAHADNQDGSPNIESLAEGAASQDSGSAAAKGRSCVESLYPDAWSTRFECMGELIVERRANPSDVVKVYKALSEGLEADIIFVNSTVRGMSIMCGIKDVGSFIASLPQMPGLESWALTHA